MLFLRLQLSILFSLFHYPMAISVISPDTMMTTNLLFQCRHSLEPDFSQNMCTWVTYRHFQLNVPEPNSLPIFLTPCFRKQQYHLPGSLTDYHPRLFLSLYIQLAAKSYRVSLPWHILHFHSLISIAMDTDSAQDMVTSHFHHCSCLLAGFLPLALPSLLCLSEDWAIFRKWKHELHDLI